jgi:nitrogen regulatory protein PII
MVDTAKVKLVTIIVAWELVDRLTFALGALGVTGYTTGRVAGRGVHGVRKRSVFDAGNVRLETLVSPATAEKILEHVTTEYADSEIVAFVHDVEAVPRSRFARFA